MLCPNATFRSKNLKLVTSSFDWVSDVSNTKVVSRQELSPIATEGTVYLICWMTTAQIDQMRTKKVLLSDLE